MFTERKFLSQIFAVTALLGVTASMASAQRAKAPAAKHFGGHVVTSEPGGHPPPHTNKAIPWSLTEGRPEIVARHQIGFFIWHDTHFVYIAETDEGHRGRVFGGEVRLYDGVFGDISGLRGEKDDRFTSHSPDYLSFRFPTHEEIDGIKFEISHSTKYMKVYLGLAGRTKTHLYLGRVPHEVPGAFDNGPLIFDMSR